MTIEKKVINIFVFIVLFLLVNPIVKAQTNSQLNVPSVEGSAPENNKRYSFYYQFADAPAKSQYFKSPSELLPLVAGQMILSLRSINLLYWNLVAKPLPFPSEPYNRKKQFGTWIIDGRNGNCLNTRSVVLVRDSYSPVTAPPGNRCAVFSGSWLDPYTNKSLYRSSEIQIDHFIPLKHAYISGGFKWDARTKCLFSNYLGDPTHLVPVYGPENLKKSDATPFSYLPPNKKYVCSYLSTWLRLKRVWDLSLIPPEVQAINKAVKDYQCDPNQFNFSIDELIRQRKYMNDNYQICDHDISPPVSTLISAGH